MTKNLDLAARLILDAQRWVQGLGRAEKGTKGFVAGTKRELASLKQAFGTVQGQMASLGVTIGATALVIQSARMDKSLTQIGQTAGASKAQVAGLRTELFRMSRETGQNTDALQAGFNVLIQSGLNWNESLSVIDATNKTMAVTGAQAETLAGALGVSATAFQFDLSKPGQALLLLDKMTVAGRKGNAELQDLSSIISRVGVNASAAGFGFDQTLAFVEGLSMIERQPERLATLADSTLRLFTNAKYMKDSQKATGVAFFGKDGSRRDPIAVLDEIKVKYDRLKTAAQRESFLSKAFGQADLDTIKGLKTLLGGNTLSSIKQFSADIGNAGGAINKDLPNAISNAADQVGRLKSTLREAADGFARPINDAIAGVTKKLLDKKEDGGLGLSGNQLAAGGALGLLGLYVGGRLGANALGKISGLAGGVGAGKALEAAAGVMPVYVVNMPGGGMGGGMDSLLPGGKKVGGAWGAIKAARAAGLARLAGMGAFGSAGATSVGTLLGTGAFGAATLAAGGTAAFGAGYGVGTWVNDNLIAGTKLGDMIGAGVTRALAAFGNSQAQEAVRNMDKYEKSLLDIHVTSEGQALVKQFRSNNPSRHMRVNSGRMMNRGRKP